MIVDVLATTLGRVAAVGSVVGADADGGRELRDVHQLVSTVRARLRPDTTIVDCLRAASPAAR